MLLAVHGMSTGISPESDTNDTVTPFDRNGVTRNLIVKLSDLGGDGGLRLAVVRDRGSILVARASRHDYGSAADLVQI